MLVKVGFFTVMQVYWKKQKHLKLFLSSLHCILQMAQNEENRPFIHVFKKLWKIGNVCKPLTFSTSSPDQYAIFNKLGTKHP